MSYRRYETLYKHHTADKKFHWLVSVGLRKMLWGEEALPLFSDQHVIGPILVATNRYADYCTGCSTTLKPKTHMSSWWPVKCAKICGPRSNNGYSTENHTKIFLQQGWSHSAPHISTKDKYEPITKLLHWQHVHKAEKQRNGLWNFFKRLLSASHPKTTVILIFYWAI